MVNGNNAKISRSHGALTGSQPRNQSMKGLYCWWHDQICRNGHISTQVRSAQPWRLSRLSESRHELCYRDRQHGQPLAPAYQSPDRETLWTNELVFTAEPFLPNVWLKVLNWENLAKSNEFRKVQRPRCSLLGSQKYEQLHQPEGHVERMAKWFETGDARVYAANRKEITFGQRVSKRDVRQFKNVLDWL